MYVYECMCLNMFCYVRYTVIHFTIPFLLFKMLSSVVCVLFSNHKITNCARNQLGFIYIASIMQECLCWKVNENVFFFICATQG